MDPVVGIEMSSRNLGDVFQAEYDCTRPPPGPVGNNASALFPTGPGDLFPTGPVRNQDSPHCIVLQIHVAMFVGYPLSLSPSLPPNAVCVCVAIATPN